MALRRRGRDRRAHRGAVRAGRHRLHLHPRCEPRLLGDRRALHQHQRHPLPQHHHPCRRPHARCRLRDGVAPGRDHARPDARPRSPARRAGAARHRRARVPVVVGAPGGSGRDHPHGQPVRPHALPRRPVPHRDLHPAGRRGRHAPAGHDRCAARQPAVLLDRHPELRALPVPLADLPDHPPGGRQGAVDLAVRAGDDRHRDPHRAQLPLRRDADPEGRDRRLVARRAAPPVPCGGGPAASARGPRRRRRDGDRLGGREHRDGPEPVRRCGGVRERGRCGGDRVEHHHGRHHRHPG
ncbi:unannotated protein [freshwater metagenome]|uniref:Unannotated protein n=1 Tax=freshwater metagenome TaxID=449393 RepID=A0A6J6GBB0_9ZZZZ